MSVLESRKAEARAAIEDARRTVAGSPFLDDRFKSTANLALDKIIAGLDDGSMPVQDAINLTGTLMNAVVVQISHAEHVGTGQFRPYAAA